MESPLAGSLQFSPFADITVQSFSKIAYAGAYLLGAQAIAIYYFLNRNL